MRFRRLSNESGFTLIELLVVVLIIGILAGIAITIFLTQSQKAQDATAKSDARNLVTHVESCYVTDNTYASCQTAAQLGQTGLAIGTQPGQVTVAHADAQSYTIVAQSPSGVAYTITKSSGSGASRTCSPASTGGCNSQGGW
jgi:type IV pilus assembly protein PilA